MRDWLKKLRTNFRCKTNFHNWTCAHEQGIKPTEEQLANAAQGGFWDYAKMYCLDCGTVYEGSLNRLNIKDVTPKKRKFNWFRKC